MTVSSAFTISRRTESFCFSRRRICIGKCEWVPPLKSLRSAAPSRPESNRNVDETTRRFAPDIHGLGAMRGGLWNQVDLTNFPSDCDQFLARDGIARIMEFGQRSPPPSGGGRRGNRARSRCPTPRRSPTRTRTVFAASTSRWPPALSAPPGPDDDDLGVSKVL